MVSEFTAGAHSTTLELFQLGTAVLRVFVLGYVSWYRLPFVQIRSDIRRWEERNKFT